MRRKVGLSALKGQEEKRGMALEKGKEIEKSRMEDLRTQLGLFKIKLKDFAEQHTKEIKKDPEFRYKFNLMCNKIGVDPLASKKGFWGALLGVGDFYYELGIQMIHFCAITRLKNGGLVELD